MSVYKEAYEILRKIQKKSKQIWNDSADVGAMIKKDDALWMDVKQLMAWYGIKGTRKQWGGRKVRGVSMNIQLMDEFGWNQGPVIFTVSYCVFNPKDRKEMRHDGFVSVSGRGAVEIDPEILVENP